MKKFIVLVAVAVLAVAVPTVSANLAGMWWERGDAGSTYQDWTFDSGANPAVPENTNNPGATANIDVVAGPHVPNPGWVDEALGRQGFWAGDPIYVDLYIPNVLPENPYKDIWMTLEYYGQLTVFDVIANPAGAVQVIDESTEPLSDLWKRTTIHWRLEPNPIEEWIHLELINSGAYLDVLTVDTICWVPEPTSLVLLGVGSLLLRKRR